MSEDQYTKPSTTQFDAPVFADAAEYTPPATDEGQVVLENQPIIAFERPTTYEVGETFEAPVHSDAA